VILKGQTLSAEVIESWPEVFGEVDFNFVPLRYLHTIAISFRDGRVWEIAITAKTKKEGWNSFESTLASLIHEYNNMIISVDFKIDANRIKKDIKKKTQKFLNKKKLK